MNETARRVGVAALLLGASQLLSRLLGVVREMVLAWQVGAGTATDAYRAAFQLPDLLNHFLAVGAIATAFIPLHHRIRQRSGEAGADRFFAGVWGTLTLLVVVATLLAWAATPAFVALYFPDFDAEAQRLTVQLTRIVLPAQVFFVSGGILRGALMAQGRFGSQALAPLVYNAGIIAGGLVLGARLGVAGFAWGALVGAALGHLAIPLLEAHGRVRLRLRIAPADPDFLRYVALALPLLLGVTVVAGDEWLHRYFGQFVGGGAIALLFYARALMQAPVGLVGQAAGTAALPALSGLVERGEEAEAHALLQRVLQLTLGLAVLAGAALAALADPLVSLLYVRGAFGAAEGAQVAGLLRWFALGVPGWVLQSVAVRAFYARGDTLRPMLLGSAVLLVVIPLYAVLGRELLAPGLALAGALAISANAAATLLWARRRHGGPPLLPVGGSALRALLVAAPAALAAAWLVRARPGPMGALTDLCVGGLAFAGVALAGVALVGDAPMREGLRRLRRRIA